MTRALVERVAKLGELGSELAERDEHEQALTVTDEAIELLRTLAGDEPERFGPSLAQALVNRGASLSALGREAEMVTSTREALGLFVELGADEQVVVTGGELGLSLVALGRADEALAPLTEARARLVAVGLDEQLGVLDNLGLCLRALGRDAEAIEVWREAVDRGRGATRRVATIATQLAALLERAGTEAEEVEAWTEACAHWRRVFERGGEEVDVRPQLANSLDSLGVVLSARDRDAEALVTTREAVELRRALAREEPESHRSTLATSLTNLAIDLEQNDQAEAALELRREALEHLQVLAAAEPEDRLGELAEAHGDLCLSLIELGQFDAARNPAEACVDAARSLVRFDGEYYSPVLARALDVRATLGCEAGEFEVALVDLEEALTLLLPREGQDEDGLVGGPRHAELVDECLATLARIAKHGGLESSPELRARVETHVQAVQFSQSEPGA